MAYPEVDWDACQVCEPCQALEVCTPKALVQIDPGDPPYIDQSRCNRCAACVEACCCGAILLKQGATQSGYLPHL